MNQKKVDAGLVSERFHRVSGIEIKMIYYRRTVYSDSDTVLMLRTVNISPESYAYFYMQCMNNKCSEGFDLTNVIKRLVKDRKTKGEGNLACTGKSPDLPAKHAYVHYVINITYK
jgi:hypothetical protein